MFRYLSESKADNKLKLECFHGTYFSAFLHEKTLKDLSGLFKLKVIKKGQVLTCQGRQVESVYILKSGRLEDEDLVGLTPKVYKSKDVLNLESLLAKEYSGELISSKEILNKNSECPHQFVKRTIYASAESQVYIASLAKVCKFLHNIKKVPRESLREMIAVEKLLSEQASNVSQSEGLSEQPLANPASMSIDVADSALFKSSLFDVTLFAHNEKLLENFFHLFRFRAYAQDQQVIVEENPDKYKYPGNKQELERSNFNYVVYGEFTESQKDDVIKTYSTVGDSFDQDKLVYSFMNMKTITCTSATGLLLSISKLDFMKFIVAHKQYCFDHYIENAKKLCGTHFAGTKMPIFDGLSDQDFQKLTQKCDWERHEKGNTIFEEGNEGYTFYIILSGELEVVVNDNIVNNLYPGMYFGEIALVVDKSRTATIRCKTDVELLSVTKDHFQQIFSSNLEFMAQLQVKLAPTMVTLRHVLHHTVGLECFTDQMKTEYSTENIRFWNETQTYSQLKEGSEEQLGMAKEMVDTCIRTSSETCVNINGVIRKECVDSYDNGIIDATLFDKAAEDIFKLMERDSYERFKAGPHFDAFLKRVGNYIKVEEFESHKVD